MTFELDKKNTLKKLIECDKSKKGSVDIPILPLLEKINQSKDYYTTSSCSGRIQLLTLSEDGKKNGTVWLYSTHDKAKVKDILPFLVNLPESAVWLKMEPPILHICARDMEAADKLLTMASEAGFRRSAILGFRKRIIIEIMIPERIDSLIAQDGVLLVDETYIKKIIAHANSRLKKSWERLKKLEKKFTS
jgi:tRNA wybutosine-synthesizing protein 3